MSIFYTGKGDDGSTGLLGKDRVSKDNSLVCAIGDVDELNSAIGVAIQNNGDEVLNGALETIQNKLFTVGAELASAKIKPIASITEEDVKALASHIDSVSSDMPELKSFVLPRGPGAYLHMARSIARRAERSVVAASKDFKVNPSTLSYLNRLSSFLFVAALHANMQAGAKEKNPTY